LMSCAKIIPCLAIVALLTGLVFTQEPTKDKKSEGKGSSPAADAPATHKVEKKPFKIEVSVKGILEAEETAEISYRPHPMVQPPPSQGAMTIRKIVDHGATVKKGELLVALDTTKINEVTDELEKMYKSNDLTEDTERMVLERQRNWLERAQFWYQSALIERDYMLKFYLPYKEKDLKDNQVKQDLVLEKAKKTLAPTLTQKQNS